jgi:hypothetical protein
VGGSNSPVGTGLAEEIVVVGSDSEAMSAQVLGALAPAIIAVAAVVVAMIKSILPQAVIWPQYIR